MEVQGVWTLKRNSPRLIYHSGMHHITSALPKGRKRRELLMALAGSVILATDPHTALLNWRAVG